MRPPEVAALDNLEFDDEITLDTESDATIQDILYPGDIGVMYGPSGVAKSFVAIDLCYRVPHGIPWYGKRVSQVPVLYVALEGVRGVRNRMIVHRNRYGSAGPMLARSKVHTKLDKSEQGDAGQAEIVAESKALARKAGHSSTSIIIIETLAWAIAGDDENSPKDIAAFLDRVSAIARETGAAVLIVHHTGKDDTRGMRGSNALFAGADLVLRIVQNGDVRQVIAEKVKDGPTGPLFSFRLKVVTLGHNRHGDPITSCELVACEPVVRQRP